MGRTSRTLSSSIGKKMLMAASGSFLSLFVLIHLAGNSTALLGRATFLAYADHLHSLGIPLLFMEILLLTAFCTHIFLALQLFFENRKARPQPYAVVKGRGGETLAARTMIYTGTVILLFLAVHLQNFLFISPEQQVADLLRTTLGNPALAVVYLLGTLAVGLHLSHGLWSLCQTLGLDHPGYTRTPNKKAAILGLTLGLLLALIVLVALFYPGFLL